MWYISEDWRIEILVGFHEQLASKSFSGYVDVDVDVDVDIELLLMLAGQEVS